MSTMNKEKLKGLQSFLKDDIWRVTEDEVSKSRGILYNAIKIATLSVREFTQGRILNKASALTYSTLLSIIPILAILFASHVDLVSPTCWKPSSVAVLKDRVRLPKPFSA